LSGYPIHTIDSAPNGSKAILAALQEEVGFLPNLAATMAESPALLEAFTTLRSIYSRTALSGIERETIALTAAVQNRCTYCAAAHSTFLAMHGGEEPVIEALRAGRLPVEQPRLAALSTFTRKLIETRGAVTAEDLRALQDAGYDRAQVLDVFVGIAMGTLAAYMHHVGGCPIDAAFAPRSWSPNSVTAA
jgi:uncharacterized peroxidase-related enzyme